MSQVPLKIIRRKVLIILGATQTEDDEKYDSLYADYYKKFFTSLAGGAYCDEDIEIFCSPTLEELNIYISSLSVDFAIIVYIGHGATMDDYQLFKLNNNEIIRPGELMPPVQQGIILLESCRSTIDNIPIIKTGILPSFKKGGKLRFPISRDMAKKRYEELLKEADLGIAVLFSCSKGEVAVNYYFSYYLLGISDCMSKEQNVSLANITNELKSTFIKKGIIQKPELANNGSLPFAIYIY